MSDDKSAEDKSYLQELKRLRDHEAKNKKVKTFLDTEILACEKTIKYHELLHDKKQVFEKLQPLEKLLELTSREALREDLVQMMLPMQKEIQRLSDEIVKQEMTKAEFKSRLVQCEEMMAVLLFSLSDGNEFEKQTTKPAKVKKESPWLMLCQAETGLDAHESQLPTTTITNYAFDESEEFAKIYIDLPGLEVSDKSKLKPTYSERHFSLLVADVEDRNYKIHFSNLTDAVDGANSKIKLKKDRIVVFLKKKQPMTWRDLTSSDSNMKKETIEKTKEKMQIIFTELVAFSFVMNSCSTDEGDLHMKKKGFYFVRDAASAAKTLAMLDAFPPKVCVFQWHDKSLGSEELLNKVLRAVIQWDCFVIWINDDSWEERKQRFDDEYLQLLTNGKAQLVGFLGRLSSDGWPLVPTTALQVTPIITCVSDFNALSSCPSEFEQLKVCIPKSMLLNELKPLRSSASRQPIVLAVADMTDADIDWLLQALNVLLPFRMLSNLQQARPAFQICLFTCKMSLFGHSRLCLELPGEVVRVEVQDYTNNPQIRSFLQKYSLRNCAFIYHTEQVAKELRGLLI